MRMDCQCEKNLPFPKATQMLMLGFKDCKKENLPRRMMMTSISTVRIKQLLWPLLTASTMWTTSLVSDSSWSHSCICQSTCTYTYTFRKYFGTTSNMHFLTLRVIENCHFPQKEIKQLVSSLRKSFHFPGTLFLPATSLSPAFLLWTT